MPTLIHCNCCNNVYVKYNIIRLVAISVLALVCGLLLGLLFIDTFFQFSILYTFLSTFRINKLLYVSYVGACPLLGAYFNVVRAACACTYCSKEHRACA